MAEKRTRSPNYPAISLPQAIERISRLYENQHKHAAPREVIAKSLGFRSLSGPAATVISTLYKYGLLEREGVDSRISERALQILFPHSPAEKATALQEAFLESDLFAEIDERFPDHLPSDDLLRNYLLRKNFSPNAVDAVILSYKESVEFVGESAGAYDSPASSTEQERVMVGATTQSTQATRTPPPLANAAPISLLEDGRIVINTTLNDKEGVDALIVKLNALRVIAPDSPKADPLPAPAGDVPAAQAGVSLMITQAQKDQLRERGYSDDQIHDMKPEDAHRALGLIN